MRRSDRHENEIRLFLDREIHAALQLGRIVQDAIWGNVGADMQMRKSGPHLVDDVLAGSDHGDVITIPDDEAEQARSQIGARHPWQGNRHGFCKHRYRLAVAQRQPRILIIGEQFGMLRQANDVIDIGCYDVAICRIVARIADQPDDIVEGDPVEWHAKKMPSLDSGHDGRCDCHIGF